MNTMEALIRGQVAQGRELMVFDWRKAARLIVDFKAKKASAGLTGDWEWTGGNILNDGQPNFHGYTYLASTWAVPQLEIDGVVHDCFCMQSEAPDWDSGTKWPAEAVAILKAK